MPKGRECPQCKSEGAHARVISHLGLGGHDFVNLNFDPQRPGRPRPNIRDNFLNNRQLLELKKLNNGLFNCSRKYCSCAGHMLEIENFVPYDMSLWSNGGSTGANNPDNQSLITFGSAKSSSSLRTYKKEKKLHVILPFSHLIHVYILATFMFLRHFCQLLRIIGDFLLNDGVDIKELMKFLNNDSSFEATFC